MWNSILNFSILPSEFEVCVSIDVKQQTTNFAMKSLRLHFWRLSKNALLELLELQTNFLVSFQALSYFYVEFCAMSAISYSVAIDSSDISQISFYICFSLHLCCVLSCLGRNIIRLKTSIQTQATFMSKNVHIQLFGPGFEFEFFCCRFCQERRWVRRQQALWQCSAGAPPQPGPPSQVTEGSFSPLSLGAFSGDFYENLLGGLLTGLKLCCPWAHGGFHVERPQSWMFADRCSVQGAMTNSPIVAVD